MKFVDDNDDDDDDDDNDEVYLRWKDKQYIKSERRLNVDFYAEWNQLNLNRKVKKGTMMSSSSAAAAAAADVQ